MAIDDGCHRSNPGVTAIKAIHHCREHYLVAIMAATTVAGAAP